MKKTVALVLFALALFIGFTKEPRPRSVTAVVAVAVEEKPATCKAPIPQLLLPRFPEPELVTVRNPDEPPQEPSSPKEWDGPRPKSVSEIPADLLPRVRENYGQQEMEILDYQLGFLDRLDKCVGSQISGKGEISLHLIFDGEGAAGDVDVRSSSLSEAEDTIALDCIRKAHRGTIKVLNPVPEYHWGTQLSFPVKNDTVYPYLFERS